MIERGRVTQMFYAQRHPDHLKRAAGVIDQVLRSFVTNLVTKSPDRTIGADADDSLQPPDKIDVVLLNASLAGVAKLADARDSKLPLCDSCPFRNSSKEIGPEGDPPKSE